MWDGGCWQETDQEEGRASNDKRRWDLGSLNTVLRDVHILIART